MCVVMCVDMCVTMCVDMCWLLPLLPSKAPLQLHSSLCAAFVSQVFGDVWLQPPILLPIGRPCRCRCVSEHAMAPSWLRSAWLRSAWLRNAGRCSRGCARDVQRLVRQCRRACVRACACVCVCVRAHAHARMCVGVPPSPPPCLSASLPLCLSASLPLCISASLPSCLPAFLPPCLPACAWLCGLHRGAPGAETLAQPPGYSGLRHRTMIKQRRCR